MKINRLKILTQFRGLKPNYEVVFNNTNNEERIEPLCFVGLNGSGKSNVLEAISECFYYLEAYSEERSAEALKKYKTTFGFDIEFELNPAYQDLPLSFMSFKNFTWSGVGNLKVRYLKREKEFPVMIFPENPDYIELKDRENFILPNRIIGYSSGMNELISNPFTKIDFFYLEKLREQSQDRDTYRPKLNRMFLMDYDANKIISVCTQIYKKDNNVQILNKEINVKDIYSFSIYLRTQRPNFVHFKFPSAILEIIDKLKSCATTIENIDAFRFKLGFKIDNHTREAFSNNWETAYDLFRDLYQLRLMNLFLMPDRQIQKARDVEQGENLSAWLNTTTPVQRIFFMDEICFAGINDEQIPYKQLSDGEHQLIHALSGLMLLEWRNSIFILDEPDTHFNPEWRSRFIYLMNEVLKDKLEEQLVFITSHSPFVISDCKQQNVLLFKKNHPPKNPEINTYGTSVSILTDEIFGKSNAISETVQNELKKLSKKISSKKKVIEVANKLNSIYGDSVEKIDLFQKLSIIKNRLDKQ